MTTTAIIFCVLFIFLNMRLSALLNVRLTKTLELCEILADSNKRLSDELTVMNAANTMMNLKINRLEDRQIERDFAHEEDRRKEA